MPENLPFTIKELVEMPWNEMAVYSLSVSEKNELISNKDLEKREYFFRKGHEWPEHSHDNPQLLLVLEGQLTHRANNREYVQNPNDLLIIPAHLPHTAYADKDHHLYWFSKK